MLNLLDKHRGWISLLGTLLAGAFCVVALLYGTRQREEVLIKESRLQVYRDMLAETSYAFIVLDPRGQIVEWGPGAERLFGWKRAEVTGRTPDFLMPPEFAKKHLAAIQRTNYDFAKTLTSVDCEAYHKDGHVIPIHVTASSFRNHVGFYHAALIAPASAVNRPESPSKLLPREPPTTQ